MKNCPKCGEWIKPITYGMSNEMHGYKLHCPGCEQFIGWGGKVNKAFHDALAAKRQHDNA